MTDYDEFEMHAGYVRTIATEMLTESFGERCPEFEEHCECCKRWQLLDELTANPFDQPQQHRNTHEKVG
jgi:hypothetical protein